MLLRLSIHLSRRSATEAGTGVVAVAGPLVDLATSVSFCLLGGSAPLLSATVRTHRSDVELDEVATVELGVFARVRVLRGRPARRP